MFTGIIDHCGKIVDLQQNKKANQLWIENSFEQLKLGESIAVDGICLTVSGIKQNIFSCDVSPETLKLTTAIHWQVGKHINLERALRPMDRIGGHFVTGHIDQIAQLAVKQNYEEFIELTFIGLDREAQKFLIKKGSIAVNGVSLTLNEIIADGFQVMLIPHTRTQTNLDSLLVGERVNIEYDVLAKLVAKQVTKMGSEVNI